MQNSPQVSIGETGTNTAATSKGGDSSRNVLQLWTSRPLCKRMPKSRSSKKVSSPCCPRRLGNLCENDVAFACSGPIFCVNCGMTEFSASQCRNVPVHEDLAYSLWAEQPSAPQTSSENEMVLTLRPIKQKRLIRHHP